MVPCFVFALHLGSLGGFLLNVATAQFEQSPLVTAETHTGMS
jgi:hypothetical protein